MIYISRFPERFLDVHVYAHGPFLFLKFSAYAKIVLGMKICHRHFWIRANSKCSRVSKPVFGKISNLETISTKRWHLKNYSKIYLYVYIPLMTNFRENDDFMRKKNLENDFEIFPNFFFHNMKPKTNDEIISIKCQKNWSWLNRLTYTW